MPEAPAAIAPHPRDPALDGLRGIAVLLIYLYHFGGGLTSSNPFLHLLGILSASGWIGVPMFFVLSGFLITGIVWQSQLEPRPPHRLRNFFARRVLRIFPVYYLCLLLAAVCTLASGGMLHDLRSFLTEVFFLQDFPYLYRHVEAVSVLPLFHLWSIAVEEQFYLLWPFLLLPCRTRAQAQRLCLLVLALSVLFCVSIYANPSFSDATVFSFNRFLLTNAGALALGALLSLSLQPNSAASQAVRRLAFPALLLGLAVFVATGISTHTFGLNARPRLYAAQPAVWLASTGLLAILLRPGTPRRLFSVAPLRALGRISYGFYIFHILLDKVFNAIAQHILHINSGYKFLAVRFLVGFALTFAVSWISYQLLEYPFLQLKRHFPLANPAS